MTPTWSEVNAAVLAVLGETARPSSKGSNGHARVESPGVFVERLFSLRHAESVGEVGEVRVLVGTVVTPLARDLLRRRNVVLRVISGREAARATARSAGEWGFAIDSRSGQVEAIRRLFLEDWSEAGADALEAARWVADGEGRGAFVVAEEASVSTWRAGRLDGIRPATVSEPEAVSRAIRHLGANMIVVEPLGKSIYLLKQIGERFRQGGAPALPGWIEAEAAR